MVSVAFDSRVEFKEYCIALVDEYGVDYFLDLEFNDKPQGNILNWAKLDTLYFCSSTQSSSPGGLTPAGYFMYIPARFKSNPPPWRQPEHLSFHYWWFGGIHEYFQADWNVGTNEGRGEGQGTEWIRGFIPVSLPSPIFDKFINWNTNPFDEKE